MKKTRLMIFGLATLSLTLTALLFTSSKTEVVSGTLLANMEAVASSDYCDEAYGPCGSGGNGAYQHSCYDKVYHNANLAWYDIVTWGFDCRDCISFGVLALDANKWVCRFQ